MTEGSHQSSILSLFEFHLLIPRIFHLMMKTKIVNPVFTKIYIKEKKFSKFTTISLISGKIYMFDYFFLTQTNVQFYVSMYYFKWFPNLLLCIFHLYFIFFFVYFIEINCVKRYTFPYLTACLSMMRKENISIYRHITQFNYRMNKICNSLRESV